MADTAPSDMTHAELAKYATEVGSASRNLELLAMAQELARAMVNNQTTVWIAGQILDELNDI